ncbi:MAG TPA: hypothetical protein VEQ11_08290 [Chloroflexota bacterium]|nr:hypothetical protein [Chloroflexota bacterium]
MGRMVRKQVYIEPRHDRLVKRRARELGVTEAELIRRAIDQVDRALAALPGDQRAWDEAAAFMQQRARLRAPQTGRAWTRDELYDERLGPLSG